MGDSVVPLLVAPIPISLELAAAVFELRAFWPDATLCGLGGGPATPHVVELVTPVGFSGVMLPLLALVLGPGLSVTCGSPPSSSGGLIPFNNFGNLRVNHPGDVCGGEGILCTIEGLPLPSLIVGEANFIAAGPEQRIMKVLQCT